jgi:trans-aconitate methyltransferase
MTNAWLEIPLADYEAHMALPTVGQAQLLSERLQHLIKANRPAGVAVVGCAGGNGFEYLADPAVKRVVGIDINAQYVETARQRYSARLPGLDLYVADIQSGEALFEPVDLIYAALLFEYVDIRATMNTLSSHCKSGGLLAAVIQMPHKNLGNVSASPYTSLRKLEPAMRLVTREKLLHEGRLAGFFPEDSTTIVTPVGKEFVLQMFRREMSATT